MVADVAVMATERHFEVVALIKGQGVEIATIRADMDQVKADVVQVKADVVQVKADVAQVKADVAQVKADVGSIKAKMLSSELSADQRHEELLNAIRGFRGMSQVAFAR